LSRSLHERPDGQYSKAAVYQISEIINKLKIALCASKSRSV
jgi:hypothetical protein